MSTEQKVNTVDDNTKDNAIKVEEHGTQEKIVSEDQTDIQPLNESDKLHDVDSTVANLKNEIKKNYQEIATLKLRISNSDPDSNALKAGKNIKLLEMQIQKAQQELNVSKHVASTVIDALNEDIKFYVFGHYVLGILLVLVCIMYYTKKSAVVEKEATPKPTKPKFSNNSTVTLS